MMPVRVQRQRTKGWRMPPNAVYVGRPTAWSNPFVPGRFSSIIGRDVIDRADATRLYREYCEWWDGTTDSSQRVAVQLRGKHLVCWCPLSEPCHADVLLEWANT